MSRHTKRAADNDATAGANPKRPKHFHAGPNPIEAGEEKQSPAPAAASASAASAAPSPPVRRLYSDTLGVVSKFLKLGDFHPVLAVSHEWSAAVCSMPCAEFGPSFGRQSLMFITSRLARHITAVHTKLASNEIGLLALNMPQLKELRCEVIPSFAELWNQSLSAVC